MSKDVLGWQYLVFDWVCLGFTFFIVLARLYVRVWLQVYVRNAWWWIFSELFVVIGWLLFLGVCLADTVSIHNGGKNMDPKYHQTPKQEIAYLKAQFAWSWMFKPSIYFMKYALLCFYVELIQKVQNRKMWTAVIVTAVFNTIGLVGQWLFIGLQCVPAWKQWSLDSSVNDCADIVAYPAFTWGMHCLTDVMVFALPFALLRTTLKAGGHTIGEWSGALIMFSLGIINVLSAIACMVLRLQPENYYDIPKTGLGESITFLFTVQIATGIAIPCCPQVRIFVKHVTGQYDREQKRSNNVNMPAVYNYTRTESFASRKSKWTGGSKGVRVEASETVTELV